MRIKFLGAAGTVTGSSYVLTSHSGQSILIDQGMFQGTEDVESLNYEKYDYDTSQLIGAILTHAHLDHCGRLPLLLKGGYRGEIWMTAPTASLAEVVLLDSAKIAKFDKERALYDKSLAIRTIERFKTTGYHKPISLGDFNITFYDAGHILGSASLEVEDTSGGEYKKIIFSGDLGNTPEDLVRATEFFDSADVVVMESTYGGRQHPDGDPKKTIQQEINKIEQTNSTLLLPAFSLERTQEILHLIKHLKEEEKVEYNTPVYLDSPMAERATEIYRDYPGYFNDHIQQEMKGKDPFDFPGLIISKSSHDSQRLQADRGKKVIIAGSGMMVGGRIVGHAAHYLPMESTRLLIVGYQGDETLGRELLEGETEVEIDGESIKVKATVTDTQAMSGHADEDQLLDWLNHIKGVKKLFLTHGDNDAREAVQNRIKKEMNISQIILPNLNQEIDLV